MSRWWNSKTHNFPRHYGTDMGYSSPSHLKELGPERTLRRSFKRQVVMFYCQSLPPGAEPIVCKPKEYRNLETAVCTAFVHAFCLTCQTWEVLGPLRTSKECYNPLLIRHGGLPGQADMTGWKNAKSHGENSETRCAICMQRHVKVDEGDTAFSVF